MMDTLNLIGRSSLLLTKDINTNEAKLKEIVSDSKFLVIGGAGSIGQVVSKEMFKRNPKKLHVVNII
jgi:FlaA1/EpsC-like NDP-sugar epimerase